MIRNPVDRIISLYFYIRRNENHYLYDKVYGENVGLKKFASSDLTPENQNDIVRRISGKQIDSDTTGVKMGKDDLENAKKVLKRENVLFGLTEAFDTSVLILSQELDLLYPYYRRKNTGTNKPKKSEISSAAKRSIKENNILDFELYKWAKDKLLEKARENGIDDSMKRKFERRQRILSMVPTRILDVVIPELARIRAEA